MAGERLFGDRIRPACKYCEHTLQTLSEGNMLCEKRGAVLSTHKCRHFIYDPLKRAPQKPRPLQKLEDAEFEL